MSGLTWHALALLRSLPPAAPPCTCHTSQLANELFPLPAKVWEVAGLKAPDAEEEDAAGRSTQAGLDAEIAALRSKPVSASSRFVDAHLNVKTSVLLVPHPGLEAAALALAGSADGPAVPLYNPYRCVLTTADEPPVFDSARCSAHDAVPGACTVDVCLLVRTLLERIAAGDMVLRVCQRILPMPITTYPDVPRCAAAVARLAPGWMQAVASQRAALAAAPAPFSVCAACSAGQMQYTPASHLISPPRSPLALPSLAFVSSLALWPKNRGLSWQPTPQLKPSKLPRRQPLPSNLKTWLPQLPRAQPRQ